jgi:hypothetical protein
VSYESIITKSIDFLSNFFAGECEWAYQKINKDTRDDEIILHIMVLDWSVRNYPWFSSFEENLFRIFISRTASYWKLLCSLKSIDQASASPTPLYSEIFGKFGPIDKKRTGTKKIQKKKESQKVIASETVWIVKICAKN